MAESDLGRVAGPTTARDVEALARNLMRRARDGQGLGQDDVAAAAGVSVKIIEAIESGELQPTLPELFQLLIAIDKELRIRIDDFDDHDKVLDERAANFPDRLAQMERHRDRLLDDVTEYPG